MTNPSAEQEDRHNQAQKILAEPAFYKVCEGCGSIVTARTNTCPNCHGYRFDGDVQRVVTQAKTLSSRRSQSIAPKDLI